MTGVFWFIVEFCGWTISGILWLQGIEQPARIQQRYIQAIGQWTVILLISLFGLVCAKHLAMWPTAESETFPDGANEKGCNDIAANGAMTIAAALQGAEGGGKALAESIL